MGESRSLAGFMLSLPLVHLPILLPDRRDRIDAWLLILHTASSASPEVSGADRSIERCSGPHTNSHRKDSSSRFRRSATFRYGFAVWPSTTLSSWAEQPLEASCGAPSRRPWASSGVPHRGRRAGGQRVARPVVPHAARRASRLESGGTLADARGRHERRGTRRRADP